MLGFMRSRLAFVLMFLFVLSGCITTQQADISNGFSPSKAYVVVGREVIARGWQKYIETNIGIEGASAARQMRGLISGREWWFSRYEDNKVVSRKRASSAERNSFNVNVSLNPFVYSQSLSSIFSGPNRFPNVLTAVDEEQIDRVTVKPNGYLAYDIFEVEPGDWVLQQISYTWRACKIKGMCAGPRNNIILLNRGNLRDDSVGFSISLGEVAYIGDATIEFDVVEEKITRVDYFGAHVGSDSNEYVEKVYEAKNMKHYFSNDEMRMREKLKPNYDTSRIVVRDLGKIL